MKKDNSKISNLNKKRLFFAFMVFSVLLFLLCIRVGFVQIINHEDLSNKAMKQQKKDEIVKPQRGEIVDRNNNELAVSMDGYSVWIRPGDAAWGDTKSEQKGNLEKTVSKLAKLINRDKDELLKEVQGTDKTLLKVCKFVKNKDADKIREAGLTGVSLSEEVKRYYPMGDFLSHTLGRVSDDNRGIGGLELEYERYLGGVDGRWVKNTDKDGTSLANGTEKYYKPEDGGDITLTIDQAIQSFTEKSVKNSLKEYEAKRVSCVVMETKTGEILSMASAPSFNPNEPSKILDKKERKKYAKLSDKKKSEYMFKMWRNPIVSDVYEPGSTAKLITTASSLEEGITNKNDTFTCNGSYTVSGVPVKCWSYLHPHGSQTLYQGVGNSCNPVFMQLALRLGLDKYYDYIESFGLTEKTGIDFPGEANPIIVPKNQATKLNLAIMGFGQTNAVTPMQIITAVSALGNDGKVMEPHLVKKITDNDGKTIKNIKPRIVRKAISKETADEMCKIMQYVVDKGGGNKAQIPGYRVGGKTGSSQVISEKGGYTNEVIASFVGMAPMDNPDVTILYIIDSPAGRQHGGTIAAPATKDLLEQILKYREIKPKYTKEVKKEPTEEMIEVPKVKGKKLSEAKKILKATGFSYKISPEPIDKKDFVVKDQYPAAGKKTQKNGIVYLYRE